MTTDLQINSILEAENLAPGPHVSRVCETISTRHPGRVVGFIYYGSSLRDLDNPEKMLDLYVLVDSYLKAHKNPVRALLNWLLPPAVYYQEMRHDDGQVTRCKYSVMTLSAFKRRCGRSAFLSVTWGRFSQPCAVFFARDAQVKSEIMSARHAAVEQMARQTQSLFEAPVSALDFWARGFRESYRTELRPESAQDRSAEIVARYLERYQGLMEALYGPAEGGGLYSLPKGSKAWTKVKWFFRRLLGKPLAGIRILNSALTFQGGYDYVEDKLYRHSGVRINVTQSQRNHPVLFSPLLAWKYWRAGAFR